MSQIITYTKKKEIIKAYIFKLKQTLKEEVIQFDNLSHIFISLLLL